MSNDVIIINGCDEKFYLFMDESLRSLEALNLHKRADMGILDLGLSQDQIQDLQSRGYIVKKPTWTWTLPEILKAGHQIGLVARTALRDYFPGYKVYLWFDADAWAQTDEFFDTLVQGAREKGAAVICENGANYKMGFTYAKWWFGNMIAAYGFWRGFKVARKPVINIGIMALSDTAPHWEAWLKHYRDMIETRRRVNIDQHAFNAAVELDHLPCAFVDARCNWIPTLSSPSWNPERKLLCEPNTAAQPISIIHLAGPNKKRVYSLDQTTGGSIDTALGYTEIVNIQKNNHQLHSRT